MQHPCIYCGKLYSPGHRCLKEPGCVKLAEPVLHTEQQAEHNSRSSERLYIKDYVFCTYS